MSTFIRSALAASILTASVSSVSAKPECLIYIDRSVYETIVPAAMPVGVAEISDRENW